MARSRSGRVATARYPHAPDATRGPEGLPHVASGTPSLGQVVARTACRITFVTVPGSEIMDRCGASTSVIWACAVLAMASCNASGMAWSAVPTTAQDGMVCHAGTPVCWVSAIVDSGSWVTASTLASAAGRPLAMQLGNTLAQAKQPLTLVVEGVADEVEVETVLGDLRLRDLVEYDAWLAGAPAAGEQYRVLGSGRFRNLPPEDIGPEPGQSIGVGAVNGHCEQRVIHHRRALPFMSRVGSAGARKGPGRIT